MASVGGGQDSGEGHLGIHKLATARAYDELVSTSMLAELHHLIAGSVKLMGVQSCQESLSLRWYDVEAC